MKKGRIGPINKRPNMIRKRAELLHINENEPNCYETKRSNFAPALQNSQIPRPPTKAVPPLGTSAAATAPSQLVFRYRLPDQMSSFHRFKLRQGAKWTIDRSTPFIGYCDIRLAAIASAPGRNQRTRLQDGAVCQPWGPQFQAWS